MNKPLKERIQNNSKDSDGIISTRSLSAKERRGT
jgi:hypothetical protein